MFYSQNMERCDSMETPICIQKVKRMLKCMEISVYQPSWQKCTKPPRLAPPEFFWKILTLQNIVRTEIGRA